MKARIKSQTPKKKNMNKKRSPKTSLIFKFLVVFLSTIIISVPLFILSVQYVKYQEAKLQGAEKPVVNEEALPKEKVNVMSFNICCTSVAELTWEDRIDGVTKTILKNNVDSVGLQEATPYWMEALVNNLSDKYAYVGVGCNTAKDYINNDDVEDEFTAIFYLKDKYDVVDSGYFWLSETPEVSSFGWGAAYKRICTWAVFQNKETKTRYAHINAHFDNESSEARKNSIPMILNKVNELGNIPVVFTGDLNFIEKSLGYKDITSSCLKDTKYIAENTMDFQTYHNAEPGSFKEYILDYCLVNKGFSAKTYKVITERANGKFTSDHYPVFAELLIEQNEK